MSEQTVKRSRDERRVDRHLWATLTRRQALTALGTGVVVSVAGCSSEGDETGTDSGNETETQTASDDGSTETDSDTETDEESDNSTDEGGKTTTISVGGTQVDTYDSLVVSIDAVTFQTSEDNSSGPTFQPDTSVDLTRATADTPETILNGVTVSYGTYATLALSVTVEEATNDGTSVDVSGGTLATSLSPRGDDPIEVEQSQFDATVDLFVTEEFGELEIDGFSARGL